MRVVWLQCIFCALRTSPSGYFCIGLRDFFTNKDAEMGVPRRGKYITRGAYRDRLTIIKAKGVGVSGTLPMGCILVSVIQESLIIIRQSKKLVFSQHSSTFNQEHSTYNYRHKQNMPCILRNLDLDHVLRLDRKIFKFRISIVFGHMPCGFSGEPMTYMQLFRLAVFKDSFVSPALATSASSSTASSSSLDWSSERASSSASETSSLSAGFLR